MHIDMKIIKYFTFQLSIARVGSTVNFLLLAPLYDYFSQYLDLQTALGWTLMVSGLTCVGSFVCSLVGIYLGWIRSISLNRIIIIDSKATLTSSHS